MYGLKSLFIGAAALVAAASSVAAIPTSLSSTAKDVKPGDKFTVTVHTNSYIQNSEEYYVKFGLTPTGTYVGSALGADLLEGYDLVAIGKSKTGHGQFDLSLTVPSEFSGAAGNYTVTSAFFGTVGASGALWTHSPNTTITIAK
ncbi:hypothetical protein CBOM_00702 [Ceraceosorus bombacis]|uniref:Uncharacterized protein n=1 Tax=Ceraceosorus bombacis TaxID=401625 RepID=A0A0P1B9X2_9BASI|nr:hypothetical protein CBOM_00702 [Ceraceosorus bombacis]